ncbi:MAG: tRNA (N(6)-L-threonylcarbamoyladenosine(37)-C(2))-methylthiotransferase MtaB, partial [Clostridia bacterium]|nr:tRNA (N(6)-L-threonylcarbamoyladenosine(37)-C(2))-methylthiotransferase MtaB [Clostridia bacterium]
SQMKTVSFCALGCRVNQYEIQSLREQFALRGFCEVEFGEECDFCIINTCAVTKESEKKSRNTISRAAKASKKIIITGCYAELCRMTDKTPKNVYYCGGCSMRDRIADICEGETYDYSEKTRYEPLTIGTTGELPNDRYRAYVKIEDGCNGKCAYCIIPKLRGRAFNRPEDEIIAEITRLAASSVSEIILTGIEVSDYGSAALCRLINRAAETEGIKRIRLGSLNPNSVNGKFMETIKNCDKFCKHLHLSVQSGCDKTLKAMRRPYGKENLKSVIDALYENIPSIMITADVISGFPGETEEDFEETLEFVEYARFMHVHAFPYSPRPHTEAAGMECQIDEHTKRERNRQIIERSEHNKKHIAETLLGTSVTVLVEKNVSGTAYGHTDGFMEAKIRKCFAKAGEYITCKVESFDGALVCGG